MSQPQVLQINVSRGGVPKNPVPEAVLTPLGLEGDSVNHPSIHGGPRQAVLLLAREVVDYLQTLGYGVFYGALGENITTTGIDHCSWRAGQRYRIGSEVIVELTKHRAPCKTLDVYGHGIQAELWEPRIKKGDAGSPFWGRAGFYASIVQGGLILPGAPIILVDQAA